MVSKLVALYQKFAQNLQGWPKIQAMLMRVGADHGPLKCSEVFTGPLELCNLSTRLKDLLEIAANRGVSSPPSTYLQLYARH